MSAQARGPIDGGAANVLDEDGAQSTAVDVPASPQVLPAPPGPVESFELAATEVTPMPGRAQVEQPTPTYVDPPLFAPPAAAGVPVAVARGAHRSEPIRVISMKDQAPAPRPREDEPRVPLHVQLRSIAEVAGLHDAQPAGLGHLAPPRDPRQARARRFRDNAIWACVAIVLACAITLAVWLVAGR